MSILLVLLNLFVSNEFFIYQLSNLILAIYLSIECILLSITLAFMLMSLVSSFPFNILSFLDRHELKWSI